MGSPSDPPRCFVLLTPFAGRYEESIIALTTDWSEHPSEPLTELEVFVGFILNKSGVQTNRQRDRSLKLKDDFDRITNSIVREFRKSSLSGSLEGRLQAVETCLAGIHLGRSPSSRRDHRWSRGANFHVQSFKIAAASALMRELNSFANEYRMETRGGGLPGVQGLPVFSGVQGLPVRTMTPRDTLPVSSTQHRQQTPDANKPPEVNRVESQRRAAPAPSPAPLLTQEELTHNLLKLIDTYTSAQWSDGHNVP